MMRHNVENDITDKTRLMLDGEMQQQIYKNNLQFAGDPERFVLTTCFNPTVFILVTWFL